jgi:anaerobic selenocysteine-containing dehydrogenase
MALGIQDHTEVKPVICCSCSQWCGVLVHLDKGRITNISGDKDHPVSQGFICPKGTRAAEIHYHPRRIHRPLKRKGARGEGQWQEVGWDEALDEIAMKVRGLVGEFGAESIALTFGTFHASDWCIGERFMNLLGSPNTVGQDKICSGPNVLAESLTYGLGPTFLTSPVPGVTRCMVLWGMRPSAARPLVWKRIVEARRRGAKLIVVDPERTTEAKQADLWLQIRPGTDAALSLGWLNTIIEEDLYDREFVEKHTVGFSQLRQRAAAYPLQKVAEITWVSEELLRESARLFATNKPGIIYGGNGLCQIGTTAVQSGRAISCMVAITGNLDVKGGHCLAGPPRNIVANGEGVRASSLSASQRSKRLGADRFPFVGNGYAQLDAAVAPAWYGKRHLLSWLATAHEPSLWQAINTGEPYPVKAVFVQHHNPLGASANAKVVAQALQSPNLDLLVVQELFPTATTEFADYILPACHWLEKPFYSSGYIALSGDYASANHRPIAPEFEHRNDYELWRDLGRRLGQEDHWPETIEELWNENLRPAGLTFESLAAQRGPWASAAPKYKKFTSEDSNTPFGTPSGKVELRSQLLDTLGYDPLPDYEEPEIFRRWSRDYPLVLTTGGRDIKGFHQSSQQMSWFRSKYPHPLVRIHPQTAAELGIADKDWVTIETPKGRVRQKACLTETLHPWVVQADRWWYPEQGGGKLTLYGIWETNINVCTDDDPASCDPLMGSWLLRGLPCRLIVETQR